MDYIEGYTLIWIGICLGMGMAFGFCSLTHPMPRRWYTVFAVVMFAAAFGIRPFIQLLVTP